MFRVLRSFVRNNSMLRRAGALPTGFSSGFGPVTMSQLRWILLQWSDTPNEHCKKFHGRPRDKYKFLKAEYFPPGTLRTAATATDMASSSETKNNGQEQYVLPTMSFTSEEAHLSPLADAILAVDGIEEVMISEDFVTVKRFDPSAMEGSEEDQDEEEHDAHEVVDEPRHKGQECEGGPDEKRAQDDGSRSTVVEGGPGSSSGTSGATEQKEGSNTSTSSSGSSGPKIGTVEEPKNIPYTAPEWKHLVDQICGAMHDHMATQLPPITLDAPHPNSDTIPAEGDSEAVLCIKEILADHVRPEVKKDGGDVRYVSFESDNGVVTIEMLGACRTCGSSQTTLRDLIERTIQHWVPEVKSVVEYKDPSSQAKRRRLLQRLRQFGPGGPNADPNAELDQIPFVTRHVM